MKWIWSSGSALLNEIFVGRIKKNNDLELTSTKHEYTEKGKYKIMVKVVDILGIDTSQVVEVEIKLKSLSVGRSVCIFCGKSSQKG